ncbi:hypothetical protein [Ralstonia sp. ASV6]|uniref:hypothetical protein n=1 Tax=Ralstonia sp. ASV6 TaxID=2795124 RepID=UPI0018EA6963|nr:hypothetical protein [Ralstonia sp. ASV6]
MSNPIRERYPALSLKELHDLGQRHQGDAVVIRLLWEVRALQAALRDAWRMEAEHSFVYPDNPEGRALMQLRSTLRQEPWLGEALPHERPITAEEQRAYAEHNRKAGRAQARRAPGV